MFEYMCACVKTGLKVVIVMETFNMLMIIFLSIL